MSDRHELFRRMVFDVLCGIQLRAKQEELQDAILYLESKLMEARADLLHVSAVLRLFETNGEVQQFPAHVNLSRMFSAGELFALVIKALTEKGGTMTTRELGAYVVQSKGWDTIDPILGRGVTHKLVYVMSKAHKRGRVRAMGYERGVRVWGLL